MARFDGDCDFVMVHDWLSSPFLAELPEGYRENLAQLAAERATAADKEILAGIVAEAWARSGNPIEASDLRRVGAILEQLPTALGHTRHAAAMQGYALPWPPQYRSVERYTPRFEFHFGGE